MEYKKQELLAKYPDKKELIENTFAEATAEGCSTCKRGQLIHKLLVSLGEIAVPLSASAPRPPCEDCYKEHIGKAIINLNESLIGNGYPAHRWLAVANLAEASAEILGKSADLATEIREIKLKMIADKSYIPELMKYLE